MTRKGKALKNRTKKGLRTEVRTSGGETALLASPVYIGQAQGGGEKKHIKRGAKIGPGASLLCASFGLAWSHASRMCFPLLSK